MVFLFWEDDVIWTIKKRLGVGDPDAVTQPFLWGKDGQFEKADSCSDRNCVQFSFLGGGMDSWRKADSCADENCVQFSFLRGGMCGGHPNRRF